MVRSKKEFEILKAAELEKFFEKRRRVIAPEKASRLVCIWVAEDTEAGREALFQMFGTACYILKVKIVSAIRVAKADSRWIEAYFANNSQEFVDAYWKGEAFPGEGESWEYLVEGRIEVIDDEQIQYVRNNGAHLKLSGR